MSLCDFTSRYYCNWITVWNRTSCTECGGELRQVYKEKCEKLINYLYYPSFRTTCWGNVVCGNNLIVCNRTATRV